MMTRFVYLATHLRWCNAKPKHNPIAPKLNIVDEISFLIVMRLLALLEFDQSGDNGGGARTNDGALCLPSSGLCSPGCDRDR
jgi:hypothetical protein